MASVETNKSVWNDQYDWSARGDEWSKGWGSVEAHWHWTIYPRLAAFLPARTILEIAPGYGRWTQFLKDQCDHLAIVDLAPNCIEACKTRFATATNISYFVNDGRSLDMVPDNSMDLIFSFDSLVHAEPDTIAAYLVQFSRKLSAHGVGIIHHSNLGEHQEYINELSQIPEGVKNRLIASGDLESCHFRAHGMTATFLEDICNQIGLRCIGQEKFPWYNGKRAIDCMSVFTRHNSRFVRQNTVIVNNLFMQDAERISKLSKIYGL